MPRETPGQVLLGVGIPVGGAVQRASHQSEGGHEVLAWTRGRGGRVTLCPFQPPMYLGHHVVRRAEELLQLVVAELPRKNPATGACTGGTPSRSLSATGFRG